MNDTRSDIRPEPRYGWVMVAMSPMFLGFALGTMGSLSVFLKPLSGEFGWQRGDTAFAYLAGSFSLGLGGILMGYLADRYKTRRIVLGGVLAMGLGYLALARLSSLWQLYLISVLLGGLGAAALFSPLLANVGGWFTRNKGLALGVATAGQALGQGILPYLATLLIVAFGWRVAYDALGIFALAVLLPLAWLVRNPPLREGPDTEGKDAASPPAKNLPIPPARSISILSFAVIFCCITMATPMIHVVALASDRGLAPENAARVLLIIMTAGFFGRIFFGRLTDRIGGLRAYMAASAWQTATVFWFTQLHSPNAFYLLAMVFGFGYAGVMTCLIICAQEFTPAANSGMATGIVALFGFIGMGLGGYQAGFFFDLTGDYTLSYAIAAFSGLFNLAILTGLAIHRSRALAALSAGLSSGLSSGVRGGSAAMPAPQETTT